MFNPRPGQQDVMKYNHGKMGVTAVPGSGKTHTLSFLAAKLIANDTLNEDQEILIVTLVNSAVNNFSSRISHFLKEFGLIPGLGYRVRTLHGLAYDIVREQPHLVGLDNHFSIADERTSSDILTQATVSWMRINSDILINFCPEETSPSDYKNPWGQLIRSIASSYIKLAKDYQLKPSGLQKLVDKNNSATDLILMGNQIYSEYQRALQDRAAVDFDDLIRLAYKILLENPDYLRRLQSRWPIVLEDEAQDSSSIQEKMLTLLTESEKNWVRVGDPNQAIFETFTTANPELLRSFIKQPDVTAIDLPHSGRSTHQIIELANFLINWTKDQHPVQQLRHALNEPLIIPTPENDPQPNPIGSSEGIFFYNKALNPKNEVILVARSAGKWISENPEKTAAILVPRNSRGTALVEELTNHNIPCIELLSSSKAARDTAAILRDIMIFFAYPTVKRYLSSAFSAIFSSLYKSDDLKNDRDVIKQKIDIIHKPEIIFSQPEGFGFLFKNINLNEKEATLASPIFSKLVNWQRTVLLPIDEMMITIGMDLFTEPSDLALTHKIALILKKSIEYYPEWQLPDFCNELDAISKNRYRLFGFSEEDLGFDPDAHKGKILVSTMHKAKGLEWDRVYLMSVNNYNFPSAVEGDTYFSEKWFVKDQRNLEAETLQGLTCLINKNQIDEQNLVRNASQKARFEFCAERLRLLFVGITRAREELIFTWNTGRNKNCTEALSLKIMREYWESKYGHKA
jgi:DNA helicase II / ATP-dependent DNA helicase PcrA